MAEKSGFFQAMWDESLMNPITRENTGWWDRDYLAADFMNYFSLLVGNGVFASPTNQLMVVPGTGRTVIVTPGWAFINGGWYHNESELTLTVAANGSSTNRVDSVRIRYSASNRSSNAIVLSGETGVIRGDTIYDLELAEIIVAPGAATLSASNITDMRPNGSVCGFVTGLLEVVSAEDLFAQFTSMFNEWFDGIKGQVTGDLAAQLQLEFTQLNQKVDQYQSTVTEQISTYKRETTEQIEEYNTSYQQTLSSAQALVSDYVDKDYVIAEQSLVFSNKVCEISDSKVTANSLIDVYFTADTMKEAEECKIYVDSSAGKITLTAEKQPSSTIKAMLRVRVR